MIQNTISASSAQRFYSWLGARHDAGSQFERAAKERALALLDLGPGQTVLNLGSGTGADQDQIRHGVGPLGKLHAADISPVMLELTAARGVQTRVIQANSIHLPYRNATFDRILSTYVLDLLPARQLPDVLAECRRVLRPDGRAALVSLTDGIDAASRAVVGAWKATYRIHPLLLGGCRPLPLDELVRNAGFMVVKSLVIVQFGVPSAVVVAGRGPGAART